MRHASPAPAPGAPQGGARPLWRKAWRLLAPLVLLLGAFGLAAQDSAPQPPQPALVLTVEGAISPASADYIIRGLSEAAERQAPLVILRMDTPGGLDTSMRQIIREILASPVPVASYVTPSGARAASAGTYILYASHVAAMAPATNLGAATPVAIGGGGSPGGSDEPEENGARSPWPFGLQAQESPQEPGARPSSEDAAPSAEQEAPDTTAEEADAPAAAREEDAPARRPAGSASEAKAINDAVAYIRGLAELRGRNADWAERAVRDAESLSAREAAALGVIDFVAQNLDDLLRQADGMTVSVGEQEVTLTTEGLDFEFLEPDWRTAILSVITNPNVALILMLVGIYGIIFEFLNPGVLVPGTVGGISLLLGLYALALLPLNYVGALLILLGLALLVAEAFAPSFGILGIGGTVALVMGAVVLIDTDVPGMAVSLPLIAAVAVMGLILTLIVARLASGAFRAPIVSGQEELPGAAARVLTWQGGEGHVWLHGERWKARGPAHLAPDEIVRVARVEGLLLTVERVEAETADAPA